MSEIVDKTGDGATRHETRQVPHVFVQATTVRNRGGYLPALVGDRRLLRFLPSSSARVVLCYKLTHVILSTRLGICAARCTFRYPKPLKRGWRSKSQSAGFRPRVSMSATSFGASRRRRRVPWSTRN